MARSVGWQDDTERARLDRSEHLYPQQPAARLSLRLYDRRARFGAQPQHSASAAKRRGLTRSSSSSDRSHQARAISLAPRSPTHCCTHALARRVAGSRLSAVLRERPDIAALRKLGRARLRSERQRSAGVFGRHAGSGWCRSIAGVDDADIVGDATRSLRPLGAGTAAPGWHRARPDRRRRSMSHRRPRRARS